MNPTRSIVALVCASAVGIAACDDGGTVASPRRPPGGGTSSAPPPAATPATPDAPTEELTPPIASQAPAAVDHSCPANTDLALGNAYTSLVCLPQLDQISYWKAQGAWAELDSVPVHVAILDLSFLVDHPDITKAVDFTWNFLDDGCGAIDLTKPQCRDVAPAVPQPPPAAAFNEDQIKLVHGTMLAGLLAGRGEPGKGVVGVNPSAELELVVRDLNTDNLTSLKYAVDQHFDVVSMSWPLGTQNGEKDVPEFEALLEQAAKQGTVVVMAAGNSALDVDQKAVYPTRYSTIPGVIAVGSIDLKGELYKEFSNYGPEYVEIAAPGTAASSGGDFQGGHYSVQIGSSYSAPMVAGAVSRIVQYLKKKNVSYTAADVEKLLLDGSIADPKLVPYFKDGKHLDMDALYTHLASVHP